jgi:nucleotide-binding universal stress UspA family protein
MKQIRTILCPVDLSPFSRRELELAVELARAFGSRLVVQHNLPATGFGMAKEWEWKQAHPSAGDDGSAEERLKQLVSHVPADVPVESLLSTGPLSIGVARLAEELPADLVLLGCHGCSTEEHASLTEDLLGRCNAPILALRESEDAACSLHLGEGRLRPLRLLVPTDFSDGAQEAVRYAYGLAEMLPAEVHLLHAIGGSPSPIRTSDPVGPAVAYRDAAKAEAEARLEALVPRAMRERVVLHLKFGTADDAILRAAEEVDPDVIVMGEHARDLVRRFFTRDTARRVLHRSACPVWFVPPARVAA